MVVSAMMEAVCLPKKKKNKKYFEKNKKRKNKNKKNIFFVIFSYMLEIWY